MSARPYRLESYGDRSGYLGTHYYGAMRRRARSCEHHAIVPTAVDRIGRCLECLTFVRTPFSLPPTRPDGI